MFSNVLESRSPLNTPSMPLNEPSSSSSQPSISHSLFLRNIPSLSECENLDVTSTISGFIPETEAGSFLVLTFADDKGKITWQDGCDMQKFTVQDVQHFQ